MHQELGVDDLLERRPERLDELVGKPPNEADRVGTEDLLTAGEAQPSGRRIERREQPVFDQNLSPGEPIQQGRLARVGVPDQGDAR